MIKRILNEHISHDKLRLHSSERNTPWGNVFDEFKNQITENDLKYYPNTDELFDPISKYYSSQNFLMGFGSDRCIKYFFERYNIFLKNPELVIVDPSFPMYEVYGAMFKMKIIKVPQLSLSFPIDDLIKKVTKRSIIVISNPSTPVGNIIQTKDLIRVLELGVPTLIDEAYIEFSDEESFIKNIEKYPNLYVTRTFSKALGSAGARFGVIFSNKSNINYLYQYRDMYETTGLTIKWIKTILDNQESIEKYINNVKLTREKLYKKISNLEYEVISSDSNWIHVKGLTKLPENVIFKRDCILPGFGNGWDRLQITDKISDYKWISK